MTDDAIERTEHFVRRFEELKSEVNRRAREPSSHSLELEKAADLDGRVRRNRPLLQYIRDVRNALQHPRHRSVGHAVHVSAAFLSEVQKLLSDLKNPPVANSVGIPLKSIRTAGLDERLGDLADEMKEKGFSHLPILNEEYAVIGVFNEAAIFDHLWAEDGTIITRDMQISHIFEHCGLDAEHTETFTFVRPLIPLDDLAKIFSAVESPRTRVGAAFVTASGKKREPLQRLITPWDVLANGSD